MNDNNLYECEICGSEFSTEKQSWKCAELDQLEFSETLTEPDWLGATEDFLDEVERLLKQEERRLRGDV